MEFKKVGFEEIPELAKIADEIWHEYWQKLLSPEQIDYMVEKFQSRDAMEQQYRERGYAYYFIRYEGENIGYFGLCPETGYMFLSKLYIKKDFRHRGLGGKSFEEIKKIAACAKFKKIRLTVNKYNKNTIAAYEKWGFKTIDDVVTPIGNGFVMDDFIMEYVL